MKSELASRVAYEKATESKIKHYKARIDGVDRHLSLVRESRDRAEEEAADLRDELSKAKALRAEEVARAADFEKALAKSEALCAEMVVTISEKDQAIAKLQAELAGNKGSWKKVVTQGEVSAMTPSKKTSLADPSSDLKERDDQIAELKAQLRLRGWQYEGFAPSCVGWSLCITGLGIAVTFGDSRHSGPLCCMANSEVTSRG
jgi:chromosome segregation ATPase